jgi:glycosyltransferase involved in cell wall biosynthesis
MKAIVANDHNFLKYIESNLAIYRNKIFYIPNYVDTELFYPTVPKLSSIKELYPEQFVILIPKFITKARGQELFIKALSLVKEKYLNRITLLLLGHIDENSEYHKYLKNLINSNNLDNTIKFLGYKDHFTELPSLINSVDLLAVPSFCREGTSLSVLEGLASKKPVLCTNIGALPELIYDNYTGFLSKPTPENLAAKLESILDLSSEELEEIAERGYEFCSKNFNKQKWSEKWVEFFENN